VKWYNAAEIKKREYLCFWTRSAVREWTQLTMGLVAGGAVVLITAGILLYLKFRRRKDPAELERLRRAFLTRHGRIVTGEMIDLVAENGSSALMLVYRYDVAGVTYEVAQDVTMLVNDASQARQAIGGTLSVRYDMRQPSNSIVMAEEWSGMPEIRGPGADSLPSPAEAEPKS
jgi:hypothetical protein